MFVVYLYYSGTACAYGKSRPAPTETTHRSSVGERPRCAATTCDTRAFVHRSTGRSPFADSLRLLEKAAKPQVTLPNRAARSTSMTMSVAAARGVEREHGLNGHDAVLDRALERIIAATPLRSRLSSIENQPSKKSKKKKFKALYKLNFFFSFFSLECCGFCSCLR
jgi:hypothetical protein